MNSRHNPVTARRAQVARQDRSGNPFKGPQSIAPNIEELRHYILTTGLQPTPDGIVCILSGLLSNI